MDPHTEGETQMFPIPAAFEGSRMQIPQSCECDFGLAYTMCHVLGLTGLWFICVLRCFNVPFALRMV